MTGLTGSVWRGVPYWACLEAKIKYVEFSKESLGCVELMAVAVSDLKSELAIGSRDICKKNTIGHPALCRRWYEIRKC